MRIKINMTEQQIVFNIKLVRAIQNGYGFLRIPTLVINKKAGEELLLIVEEAKLSNTEVIGHFEFELPKMTFDDKGNDRDAIVMEYWLQIDDQRSFTNLYDFYEKSNGLMDSGLVRFTPYFNSWACNGCLSDNPVTKTCVSGGKYCAKFNYDAQNELMLETLRQICILENHGLSRWWQYLISLMRDHANCLKDSTPEKIKACSNSILVGIGFKPLDIEKCVNNSFVENGNFSSENEFLKKYRNLSIEKDVLYTPYINVNGQEYLVKYIHKG